MDSDEDSLPIFKSEYTKGILVDSAPEVSIDSLQNSELQKRDLALKGIYNFERSKKNHLTGNVQETSIDSFLFEEQRNTFDVHGITSDPSHPDLTVVIRNTEGLGQWHGAQGEAIVMPKEAFAEGRLLKKTTMGPLNKEEQQRTKLLREKRVKKDDPGSSDYLGPWAGYEFEKVFDTELDEEEKLDILKKMEENRKKKVEAIVYEKEKFVPSCEFFGDYTEDYRGKPWIAPPTGLKKRDHTCYIPKKVVHNYIGHKKGVQAVRFFPKTGHLLLSGSADHDVRIWDVNTNRKCLMIYKGHSEGIRDVVFSADGSHFFSIGYDCQVQYWDTATGSVLRSFETHKFPMCIRAHPDEDKQYSFIVGTQNRKIIQFDVRSGNKSQQYSEHLGAINSLCFLDNNRKFISCSDDKKVFLWEYGSPSALKHLSETEMNLVTSTALHAKGKYVLGQTSDNKIIVFDGKGGTVRWLKKKKFQGQMASGYTIGVCSSSDGQFVASGDANGRIFFWDWKSMKNYSVIPAYEHPCIGIEWHPVEPSKFVSCSWDGAITFWD